MRPGCLAQAVAYSSEDILESAQSTPPKMSKPDDYGYKKLADSKIESARRKL